MLNGLDLINERENTIVMSNRLIQNSYYELSIIPLKTLLYAISKIKRDDTHEKEYSISVTELCQVCRMPYKGTNAYKGRGGIVYKAMRELRAKHLDLFDEQGRAFNTGWFSKVKMEKDNDTVYYTFDSDLMPYLFNLTKEIGNFTITTLSVICSMETIQGIRMYLFLRSIAGMRKVEVTLDEIRERTGHAGKYEAFKDLRIRVIEPAIEEINNYSDIEVKWEVGEKEGKKIKSIVFTINSGAYLTADEKDEKEHRRNMKLYGVKSPAFTYRKERRIKYIKR